jgi:hypothetical protein
MPSTPTTPWRSSTSYLRAENAAMTNEMNYPTAATRQPVEKIKPEIAGNKTIFVEADYIAKMIAPSSFSNEAREAMATAYNAFKKGKYDPRLLTPAGEAVCTLCTNSPFFCLSPTSLTSGTSLAEQARLTKMPREDYLVTKNWSSALMRRWRWTR